MGLSGAERQARYRAKNRARLNAKRSKARAAARASAPVSVPVVSADPAGELARWSADVLKVPPGHPKAGQPLTLPDFALDFLRDALAPGVREAGLFVGRKNAKSAVIAAYLLARLVGPLRDGRLSRRSLFDHERKGGRTQGANASPRGGVQAGRVAVPAVASAGPGGKRHGLRGFSQRRQKRRARIGVR